MQMTRSMKKKLGAVVVLGAMTIGGFAIAASNTADPSNAGQNNPAISGFTVTNVTYDADATDPQIVDNVTFTIVRQGANSGTGVLSQKTGQTNANTNAEVWIRIDADGAWFQCDVVATGAATCDLSAASPDVLFENVDEVNIVAYDKYVAP